MSNGPKNKWPRPKRQISRSKRCWNTQRTKILGQFQFRFRNLNFKWIGNCQKTHKKENSKTQQVISRRGNLRGACNQLVFDDVCRVETESIARSLYKMIALSTPILDTQLWHTAKETGHKLHGYKLVRIN